jgi:hypothetical protein
MKNFENTLFLESRGCDFFSNDELVKLSDVGNYRTGVYNYSIKGKNNIEYSLEFGSHSEYKTRYTNKRTGKALKKPITELNRLNALHISTYYENDKGCFGDLPLEKEINSLNLFYTKEDILKAVNYISRKQYTEIIIISYAPIKEEFKSIYALGGYREKAIIDNLAKVSTKMWTPEHHVFTFTDNDGNTFDYDMLNKRITG